jgi:hypothetical protein
MHAGRTKITAFAYSARRSPDFAAALMNFVMEEYVRGRAQFFEVIFR